MKSKIVAIIETVHATKTTRLTVDGFLPIILDSGQQCRNDTGHLA
ncbi:hypothetical protein [Rhizobium sp. BK418]|nr:hypothetical protein [Rhizobium sp. BK418]